MGHLQRMRAGAGDRFKRALSRLAISPLLRRRLAFRRSLGVFRLSEMREPALAHALKRPAKYK
jgi:hypothetical protein